MMMFLPNETREETETCTPVYTTYYFLIQIKGDVIPIEVKADANTQSKSLNVYNELYSPKYMIRISTKDFGYNPDTKIKSIPLYATFLIKDLVD